MDKFQLDQVAFYHEDGEIDKVRILENTSDSELIKYKLEVLEIVQESRVFKPSDVGDIFDCEKTRDSGGCSGLWYLRDD